MAEACPTCQALEHEIALVRRELAAAGRDVAPVQSIDDNDWCSAPSATAPAPNWSS
jgi:hypothetical protein